MVNRDLIIEKMGDSYLQRKMFNRMRSQRNQTKVLGTTTQQKESTDSRWALGMPTNSFSSPQLDLIRNRSESELDDGLEDSNSSSIGIEQNNNNNNRRVKSEIKRRKEKRVSSKLKAASRVIFFFRRANSTSNNSSNKQQDGKRNTSTDTAEKRRSMRLLNHHLSSSSQASADGQASPALLAETNGSQQQTTRNNNSIFNNKEIPQFIVPKTNALKLPLVCLIKSLDGELMREVFVHRYELGQYLIESLKVSVGISDCKYFGLKMAKSFDDQEDLRNVWLDLNESVCKQIKNKTNLINQNSNGSNLTNNIVSAATTNQPTTTVTNQRSVDFYLRIKFYPPNLARVQDPFLRNYLWLQLRRDLRLGKLTSSMNNLTLLMACVLQYELGDYRDELVERIPELNILPNQDLIEEQAIGLWSQRLMGHKRHQAQMQFLRAAVILETYGFDYYPVRDHQRQRAYLLGFNYAGIKTIRNGRIVHHFSWHSLSKISYERRMIIFHIYPTENSKRKQILGFKCLSNEDCQSLYMRLLEQKYFFTVDLAYFDKSIRRPTCLYTAPSQSASADWTPLTAATDEQMQTTSYSSRFTSCGPSLDTNGGELVAANELGGDSLEDGSQNSSSSANCYTCDQLQSPATANSELVTGFSANLESSDQVGGSFCGGELRQEESNEQEVRRQNCHQPPTTCITSLRRTQWHRQRLARQYSSGVEEEDLVSQENQIPNSLAHNKQQPTSEHLKLCDQNHDQQTVWTKVVSCIRSCEPTSSNETMNQRLVELAESVLIQPISTLIQCNNNNDNFHSTQTRSNNQASDRTSIRLLLMPALRFCLLIMVMNFVIRWTDSLSSSLIELLTLNLPTLTGSPIMREAAKFSDATT